VDVGAGFKGGLLEQLGSLAEDPFERMLQRYLEAVKAKGGAASFNDMVEWAGREGLGSSVVVAVVLNELVSRGLLEAPEGLREVEGFQDLKAPAAVRLPQPPPTLKPAPAPTPTPPEAAPAAAPAEEAGAVEEGLKAAIAYLNDYWSVGELRLVDDLKSMGVKDPPRVVRRLLELGYAERTSSGVINATDKLPRVKRRGPSLAEFM
jgi:hypothetical protein